MNKVNLSFFNRVVANIDGKYVPVPVNIDTVNTLLSQDISDTAQMKQWLNKNQVHNDHPQNGEEAALSRVGKELYEQLFKPYTYKQWAKDPKELNASVLLRIPVSDSFDDRYFPNDPYQALPTFGYTAFVKKMLEHPNISVLLNVDYFEFKKSLNMKPERTIYTGPIDSYFSDSGLPKLEYRSIHFESTTLYNTSFYQPNSVVNYPKGPEKFTRIVEYKHLLAQKSLHTTIVKEFSRDTGDPYYPVPNRRNQLLYSKYKELAQRSEKSENVHFVGRLANYKYFNMDQAILNAINIFKSIHNMPIPGFTGETKRKVKEESLTMIISHCNESLQWLKSLTNLYQMRPTKIVLYEKCNNSAEGLKLKSELKNKSELIQYHLPNVGREGHTWLDFILSKQSLFGDLNLFIQAKPHVALQKIMEKIQDSINKKLDMSAFLVGVCTKLENSVGKQVFPHKLDAKKSCDWVKKFIKTTTCRVQTCFLGEFLVTGPRIRRTLAKYRTPLMEMHQTLSKENNPVVGHILERLWLTIFTYKGC